MKYVLALILLFFCPNAQGAIEIVNGSFEDIITLPIELPTSSGYWAGDICEVVEVDNGITPFAGNKMLKFVNTTRYGASASSVESQLYQFVDLSGYQEYIATGEAVVDVSYYVNRVAGNIDTDTEFKLTIEAFSGSPANYPNINYITFTDSVVVSICSDSDTLTWENVRAESVIPPTSEYLCIIISARENVQNNGDGMEFDGHYADKVELEVRLPISTEESSWGKIKSIH